MAAPLKPIKNLGRLKKRWIKGVAMTVLAREAGVTPPTLRRRFQA